MTILMLLIVCSHAQNRSRTILSKQVCVFLFSLLFLTGLVYSQEASTPQLLDSEAGTESPISSSESILDQIRTNDAVIQGAKKNLQVLWKAEKETNPELSSFHAWAQAAKKSIDGETRKLALRFDQSLRVQKILIQSLAEQQAGIK